MWNKTKYHLCYNMVSVPALIKKLPLEGEIRTVKQSMKLSINPSLVMMRECPCSTKTREVLGNPSPPPSRFSSALGFAPLDPWDFPRASPSGNLLGLGKLGGGDGFPNTSLLLVEHGYIAIIHHVLVYCLLNHVLVCCLTSRTTSWWGWPRLPSPFTVLALLSNMP